MTAISLNDFLSVAQTLPQDGKMTVAEGQVKPVSTSTIGTRLVTWVTHPHDSTSQKQADQSAFRTALCDHYGKDLGDIAYKWACNACGHSEGKPHHLTAGEVKAGIKRGEQGVLTNEHTGIRQGSNAANRDAKYDPPSGTLRNTEGKMVLSITKELNTSTSSKYEPSANRVQSYYTEDNPAHVERELLARLSNEIAEVYGPLIAHNAAINALDGDRLQTLLEGVLEDDTTKLDDSAALKLSETRHPMKIAVERLEEQAWKIAEAGFLQKLPSNAKTAIRQLDRQLQWSNLPQLAAKFGKDVGWDSETATSFYATNIAPIHDLAIERLLERQADENYLGTVTVESFSDLLVDAFNPPKEPASKITLGESIDPKPDGILKKTDKPSPAGPHVIHWA